MSHSWNPVLRHRGTVVAVLVILATGAAQAGGVPAHGHFVQGAGSVSSAGKGLTVDQATRTGIINWKSFSIGKRDSVIFNNAHGATLNIVRGGDLSRIAGSLQSSGSVYLVNRAGLLVTKSGVIDTQGNFAAGGRSAEGSDGFANDRRLHPAGTGGNAVNRGTIVSNGSVLLAGARVANSGAISGRNVSLTAERHMNAGGTIRASGRVETSGRTVNLSGIVLAKRWLIDPTDLTVDSAAATSIDTSLGSGTNVKLKTTASGATGPGSKSSGKGDIIVASALSWSSGATLTLDAYHGITIKKTIAVKGTGGLTLVTNDGGTKGTLTFQGGHATFTKLNAKLSINGAAYTLVNSLATLASDIKHSPAGKYALSRSYDASSDGIYKSALVPTTVPFKGVLEGLGNTISNLTISSSTDSAAMIDDIGKTGIVENLSFVNANVKGKVFLMHVGVLAGDNEGTIRNVSVDGTVGGAGDNMGGLVGINQPTGSILFSSSAAAVTDNDANAFTVGIGGLVGDNDGLILSSSATGDVLEKANAQLMAGGLVGFNDGGTIKLASASGSVTATGDFDDVGGLAGYSGYDSGSRIDSSHASGAVTGGYFGDVGGLVGIVNSDGIVSNSYATGNASGGDTSFVGGVAGFVDTHASLSNVQASGDASGGSGSYVGGIVGQNDGTISVCSASGAVSGTYTGPIYGYNLGTVNC